MTQLVCILLHKEMKCAEKCITGIVVKNMLRLREGIKIENKMILHIFQNAIILFAKYV